jgi:hypothetical protein
VQGSVLIYETEGAAFAASVIESLKSAHIECYSTGGRLSLGRSDPTICIYICNGADYRRANEILIKHGAVVERPLRLPSGWTARISILGGVLLFSWLMIWLLSA